MTTKAEFQQAIADSISSYPTAAQFYQAQDPRLLSQLNAIATMLAMFSAEQQVESMEPFTMARDMTVLADAAVKGVLAFGKATRVRININNVQNAAFTVATGRRINDTQGRAYRVDTGATIPANSFGFVEAVQESETSFDHTVTVSRAFYQIAVPLPEAGRSIQSVRVLNSDGDAFEYVADFVNVSVGELTFHLETDETQQLYIQFGAANIAGYQPDAGEVMTVIVLQTEGAIEIDAGSLFAFEYSGSLYENGASLTLDSVLSPGAAPMDIDTMREVCSYPSTYDGSAVYLGNFDFLVRRNLSPFKFLSVWNEQREEEVRGADEDNINTLFVAARKNGVVDATLRQQIKDVILAADDSYKIKDVAVVDVQIPVAIIAYAQAVYDFSAVEQQITEIVLREYGEDSAWAKRGESKILYKKVYDLLETEVQALQGQNSDIRLTVTDPEASIMPEQFRYVSPSSLSVTVQQAT